MTTTLPDDVARETIRTATDRTLFVNAGAGSGKTKALVDRVAQLVLVDGVPLAVIATVTFTEKAGAELRDRLRARFEHEDAGDSSTAARARAALDALDEAAIGTLHSFAQRILSQHPIEARLPPVIEVLDEVGSGVAFAERWEVLQRELLDDDSVAEPLLLGLELGVRFDHLRSLARRLGNDWDLISEKALAGPEPRLVLPELDELLDRVHEVAALRRHCRDGGCKLLAVLDRLAELAVQIAAAHDEQMRFGLLTQIKAVKVGNTGRAADWAVPMREIRDAVKDLAERAESVLDRLVDQCLQLLTRWIARKVLEAADLRREEGRLEFHDLLVLSRDLLQRDAEVRVALHRRYSRLLLDEFQDTDPVQAELAVRIAAGADGGAERWQDVEVPPGRLFFVGDAKQSIYRFRRADIATYLEAEQTLGEAQTLSANFRSVPGVLDWVNDVFSRLIVQGPHQPAYQPLARVRPDGGSGPPVTILGPDPHPGSPSADQLRAAEAADVAGMLRRVLDERWQVWDESARRWRAAEHRDIAVLVPSRTSLPALSEALSAAGVPFRAEASSLVYQSEEIRELLMCARALSDPNDDLALLSVLRSPLFGCGDDDLFRWRHASKRPGWWHRDERGELETDGPVGRALQVIDRLTWQSRWQSPSQVLERIVSECRVLEVATGRADVRDVWRRVRFVIDQARAWHEISGGGLREYVAWAGYQAQEATRVAEAVLPETDSDAVRAMTIHAAKGLEFPIVVMSGMSTRPNTQKGVQLRWTADGVAVSLRKGIQTEDFGETQPLDEQMDDMEKRRLLYVAATRARDHLIVSLHREETPRRAAADLLAGAGAVTRGVELFSAEPSTAGTERTVERFTGEPPPALAEWERRIAASRTNAAAERVRSASGMEGTEPELVLAETVDERAQGMAKGARDLELPPWSKGRYGSAVGRAVHAVLQSVDLAAGDGLDAAVAAQSLAEGVIGQEDLVRRLAQSALDSELVVRAAQREHWRESYVGTVAEDGTLLEGYVDLIFRDDDGALVVVDYKTDAIPRTALQSRVTYYAPQMQAYRDCLVAATGGPVRSVLLFLHPGGSIMAPVS